MARQIATAFVFVIVALASQAFGQNCNSYLLNVNSPSPSPILSVAAINGILTEHNRARRNVNPIALEMPMLQWDQTLANFAQEYMDTCVGLVHSSGTVRSNRTRFGYSYVGENLAAGTSTRYTPPTGGEVSTAAWNAEVADWTYPDTCRAGGVCGHYTQNIWASTTHVGCGYARCDSQPYRNYWSCVYGPGGNYRGQAPYARGNATHYAACQNVSGTANGGIVGGSSGSASYSTTLLAAAVAVVVVSLW